MDLSNCIKKIAELEKKLEDLTDKTDVERE